MQLKHFLPVDLPHEVVLGAEIVPLLLETSHFHFEDGAEGTGVCKDFAIG
jgi:hypothetical protein